MFYGIMYLSERFQVKNMIKLENISKYYYSANAVVPALRKIRLEFQKGEFVAITGESGSGKSTLLNIISGLDTYDEGELYILGEATSHFDDDNWEEYRKNKIGFVFQNYNLIENYSALYNVESVLLIQGYEYAQARKMAKELLGKVGLKGQANQRTSKLSSGQKQRLSIARALAKNTDIIVADEPTGNLDSENGHQIMELFGKLSKDKLIIVVTHNYEETAPYVTRKIRLHDGEIVSDTQVNDSLCQPVEEEVNRTKEALPDSTEGKVVKDGRSRKADSRIAWRFTRMNIATQPRRVILFLCFLLFTAIVSYIFLGEISSNIDDTFVKDYDARAFLNGDNTRIIVKKADGNAITKEDLGAFQRIKHVVMADQYDYANDINYYINLGVDYDYTYQPKESVNDVAPEKIANFLQATKFMKSDTCISKKDLSTGRLPKARNEIVLWSKDESVLDSHLPCYFTSQNMWGYDNYYMADLTVVGLLKNESSQVYFSSELCDMLSAALYDDSYNIGMSMNIRTGEYDVNLSFIPVIGDNKENGELKVSSALADNSIYTLPGEAKINVYRGNKEDSTESNGEEYEGYVLSDYNPYSIKFIEVSKEFFNQLCDYQSNQASLYMKDYIYTDYVLRKLKDMGYQAISPYRVCSVEYNPWKVDMRNATLVRSLLVLLIICLLEIMIIGSFLRIKHKNYLVLASMGMNHKTIQWMNYLELLVYTAIALLITVACADGMNLFGFRYLRNMMKYYNLLSYAVFVAFNLFMITATVWFFNRYLKRKQKWS
jgi:putative ABC transport system permease protein